jgi:ribosome-associated translation inhibitor RaiA
MQVIINPAEKVELSDAFSEHIHRALEKVDRRFGDWLTRTEVFIKDINGPKGGVDKHCRMEARPRGSDPIVVEHQDTDSYTCVTRTAEKLASALDKKHGRMNARERQND